MFSKKKLDGSSSGKHKSPKPPVPSEDPGLIMKASSRQPAEGSSSDMRAVYSTLALAVTLIVLIFSLTSNEKYVPPIFVTDTPSPTSSPTLTNTVTLTPTNTLSVISPTTAPNETKTATSTIMADTNTPPFANPIVGVVVTNGPPLFQIESWDVYNEICRSSVTIYGVIISHGTPPYKLIFWTQEEPYTPQIAFIKQVIPRRNFRDYAEFIPPVVIVKGSYKHVELEFQRGDGLQVTWADDLFYPLSDDETCN